jgi:rifampicin phosphotransferase
LSGASLILSPLGRGRKGRTDPDATRPVCWRHAIVPIPSPEEAPPPDPAEVGSQAASLICIAAAGLRVPPGRVLPVSFFASWLGAIRASDAWVRLTQAPPERWGPLCEQVKGCATGLPWSDARDALDALRRDLAACCPGSTFAVRSSSPEEELAAASFAGGYETRLGVALDTLEPAIRACFASWLDARLLAYKREHGLELWSPRIAVIVQRQVDSAFAGAGFSIDPTTNDYDEAVIDASWGLGNAVVEGRVSPDHFVVDKRSGALVDQTLGNKQVSTWSATQGGTVERAHRPTERTLSDAQLREMTSALSPIEELYGVPVDVEWAYEAQELHLLQARPITSWVPLPPEMVTEPGEPRRLYADGALSKGLTINEPISPMGLEAMEILSTSVLESRLGPLEGGLDPETSPFFFAGGRMYVDLSQMLWLSSPKATWPARTRRPTR